MRPAITLFLLTGSCLAQTKPDFSGVFLRKQTIIDKGHAQVAVPRILEITQKADEVVVTAIQNGETAIARYPFVGQKSNKLHARLKRDSLVIRGPSEWQMPSEGIMGMPPISLEKRWMLSADLQQLTIRTIPNSGVSGSEVYIRQPSMSAAQGAAQKASGTNCDTAAPLSALSKEKVRKFDTGAPLGATMFEQITRCVLYDAVLSGDFFKDLERAESSGGVQFRKKGRSISAYAGDLVVEVQPHMSSCPGEMGNWAQTGPREPESVEQLRFMVRWLGADQRDLGEVPTEFLHEPMREINPPAVFYRMRIPAQDLPLADDLEVTIFSRTGEQLACIKGHI